MYLVIGMVTYIGIGKLYSIIQDRVIMNHVFKMLLREGHNPADEDFKQLFDNAFRDVQRNLWYATSPIPLLFWPIALIVHIMFGIIKSVEVVSRYGQPCL